MSDDQCPATTRTKHGTAWCQLATGHPEHHTNQSYRWYGGYPDSHTPPVPACTDTIWVSDEIGTVACSLGQGHTSDHTENTTGRALHWPLVDRCLAPDPEPVTNEPTRHYASNDLAGVSRDDLIHNLFKRVEQLEQSSADAGVVDGDLARLINGLGEVKRRVTALERLVSGTDLNRQFERLNGAICTVNGGAQERHQETGARLKAMWDVLAAMAPVIDSLKPAPLKVICGAPDLNGHYVCELDQGHDGRHYCGTSTWPREACGAPHPVQSGRTCVRPQGHTAAHRSSSSGDVRLVWNDEPAPDQAERASGSPVRCPTQFREGQCLGWAGHDGECSAVNSSGDPQMEDPAGFTEQMDHGGGYPSDPVDPFQD